MVELLREVSGALFSAPYRLEILRAIAGLEDDPFTSGTVHAAVLRQLGEGVDGPDKTTVNRTLTSLRSAALIEPAGRGGAYRRVTSTFWAMLLVFCDEIEQRFSPTELGVVR